MSLNFKKVFSTPFFDIEKGIDPNNLNTQPYYRLTSLDSVICCVMTMQGEFVMVRQFRPNIDEYTLEFPAGGLLKSEEPLEAAKREFLEETSLTADFIYLGDFKLMMNRTTIKEYIFFGINPKTVKQSIIEKGIEVHLVNRDDLKRFSVLGEYKQLAGLGIIQLASNHLELDIMSESVNKIFDQFKLRQRNEC